MNIKSRKIVEFLVLFIFIPVMLIFINHIAGRLIIPVLLITSFIVFKQLQKDPAFDRHSLWKGRLNKKEIKGIIYRFIPGALLVGVLTYFFLPDHFLAFPKEVPGFWILVMILYPLISVYPQEVIFRTYIFHRYQSVFSGKHEMITASAVAFGMYHLFFCNWIAPVLSFAGGFLFASTYARSRSTAAVVLEHALWGDLIFTIGLGMYFYGGNI
ncbi:CPBP family intramembrane glutamic endopeptidase [Fidelibacter multiformis]|jgi:membrane protease YdiL (CAAX protease family)|uniref:CPBP family intramembrane glutamic endopeptidase n=1 Tax=Fidelibacter multiformis TaxID=3377529 RepID=UPI0037DD64DC